MHLSIYFYFYLYKIFKFMSTIYFYSLFNYLYLSRSQYFVKNIGINYYIQLMNYNLPEHKLVCIFKLIAIFE